MPKCLKCSALLPPQLLNESSKICLFCELDRKVIVYGEPPDVKTKNKDEVIKEYDIFLKMVKEKNEILKNAMKGDTSSIPTKILED